MLVSKNIDITKGPSKEQMAMLAQMEQMPIVFDEDAPELSDEDLKKFHRVNKAQGVNAPKQQITLDLSPWAMKQAKSMGSEYRTILSRILEEALRNKFHLKASV